MSDFGKAFRAARSSGKKVFSYNGKSYTTKLKSETAGASSQSAKKTVPTPTPRPDPDAGKTSPNGGGAGRTKDDLMKKPTPGIAQPGSAIDKAYQKKQDADVTAANARQNSKPVPDPDAGKAPVVKADPGRTKDDLITKPGVLASVARAGSAIATADQKRQDAAVTAANAAQKKTPVQPPDTAATRISRAAAASAAKVAAAQADEDAKKKKVSVSDKVRAYNSARNKVS